MEGGNADDFSKQEWLQGRSCPLKLHPIAMMELIDCQCSFGVCCSNSASHPQQIDCQYEYENSGRLVTPLPKDCHWRILSSYQYPPLYKSLALRTPERLTRRISHTGRLRYFYLLVDTISSDSHRRLRLVGWGEVHFLWSCSSGVISCLGLFDEASTLTSISHA
jgi:hypothetical protein